MYYPAICQYRVGWNMTLEGVARGGMRTPNAHDGRAECSGEKPIAR